MIFKYQKISKIKSDRLFRIKGQSKWPSLFDLLHSALKMKEVNLRTYNKKVGCCNRNENTYQKYQDEKIPLELSGSSRQQVLPQQYWLTSHLKVETRLNNNQNTTLHFFCVYLNAMLKWPKDTRHIEVEPLLQKYRIYQL